MTNAKVEYDLRKWYSAFDPRLQPWNRFDMIIVDEVHSLFSDATYQSASFYVRRLIEETLRRSQTCKVIVMTGSPQILKNSPLLAKAHLIDRMQTCVNVTPKSLRYITRKEAAHMQERMLASNEKFIAFYNHVADLLDFEENLEDTLRAKITLDFSKEKHVQQMKRDEDPRLTKMIATQEYLAEHERLPEDVIAFLSTSKNKEGINIKNKDIRAMFIESHAELDVIQMTGRLREPVDRLYVVVDSKDHRDSENPLEYETAQKAKLQAAINDEHYQICRDSDYSPNNPEAFWQAPAYSFKEIKAYIDHEHKKYPYLRYDYFTDRFLLCGERKVGKAYYAHQREIFEKARLTRMGLMQLARRWFPGIECSVSKKVNFVYEKQVLVDSYLTRQGWLTAARLGSAEKERILRDLNQLLGAEGKQLKSLLKNYGYDLVTVTQSHKKDTPCRIVVLEKTKVA